MTHYHHCLITEGEDSDALTGPVGSCFEKTRPDSIFEVIWAAISCAVYEVQLLHLRWSLGILKYHTVYIGKLRDCTARFTVADFVVLKLSLTDDWS